jgi:hypothetical protein
MYLKKILLNNILLFVCSTSFAQPDNYIKYYRNIEDAYQKGVFASNNDSTIFYLNAAFSNVTQPFPEDYFVISQAYLGKKDNKKYFEYLLKSIDFGIDSSVINKHNSYSFLKDKQIDKCIVAYNKFKFTIDTALFLMLDSVCKEDQRVRRELAIFGSEEGEKHVKFQDSLNSEWIYSIIKTKGWPGRKIIGNDRKSFILLVHLKQSWMDKNFFLLRNEIINGNLNPSILAGVFDKNTYKYGDETINYNSFLPENFIVDDENEKLRAKNRWEIGALSRKVFEARNYKIREWKPKNLNRVGNN